MLLAFLCTSCSEDYDGLAEMEKYPQLYMVQARGVVETSLFMKDEVQTIVFGASYGGLELPKEEIGVSFEVSPELVDAFNQQNNTSYEPLPTDAYTIEMLHTIIKVGSATSEPLSIQVHTHGKLEARKEYLLPVTLVSTTSNVPVREDLRTTYFLIKGDYQPYDRSTWEVVDVSSEETEKEGTARGYANNMLDGDVNTYWHNRWFPAPGTTYPHWVIIDMGVQRELLGFVISGRLGRGNNVGNPEKIVLEVSNDQNTWETIGNFELSQTAVNEILLDRAYRGRYLRLTVNQSWGYAWNTTYISTHIAELEAF